MSVDVSADEKIVSCRYDNTYNLRKGSFKESLSSSLYSSHVARAQSCNEIVRICVKGYSCAFDLNPSNLLNLMGDARIRFNQK